MMRMIRLLSCESPGQLSLAGQGGVCRIWPMHAATLGPVSRAGWIATSLPASPARRWVGNLCNAATRLSLRRAFEWCAQHLPLTALPCHCPCRCTAQRAASSGSLQQLPVNISQSGAPRNHLQPLPPACMFPAALGK
jgi:hypothetical protein